MKKILSFFISLSLGLILLWGALKYIISWQELKTGLLSFSFLEGLIILFLSFVVVSVEALRWGEILKSKGHTFSFSELM